MTNALRPLTLGELLDRTFTLFRQHFLVFVGIVALPNLLLLAFQVVNRTLNAGTQFDLARVLTMLVSLLAVMLVSIVAMAVAQAATVIAVSQLHLERPISISDAFASIKGRIVGLCFIMIGVGIAIFFGFLLLILPGIFLALRWSLVVPAAVLERKGLGEAMSRSAVLIEGHYGRVFMIYFLYLLLVMVFSSVWQIPILVGVVTTGGQLATPPLWAQIAQDVCTFITQCLVGPLLTIALALVYYDERVRKEAFDLEHMLEQLDGPTAAPVTT
jgi:hypothetical protein